MSGAGVVRLLIGDPSSTYRQLVRSVVERDTAVRVVGEASDGEEVLDLTRRLSPALVLMDVDMPVMDGLETTKRVMREHPTPIIVVTTGTRPSEVEAGLNAVRHGALTVLPKLSEPFSPTFEREAAHLVTMVKALADVKVIRRRRTHDVPPYEPSAQAADGIVVVAASTGGPPALCRFLNALPLNLTVPVVVVQHLADGFIRGLVGWLSAEVRLPVSEAVDGQLLEPGCVYLAGDDRHLEIDGGRRARYRDGPPLSGFRPSASALFQSAARWYGPGVVAVVLTGMGDDGLAGARAVHEAKGKVLVQDASTAVVNGMPGAVAAAGLADVVGRVEVLAAHVAAAVTEPTR